MIIGGAYPGGYTPLGVPAAPVIIYIPKFGALRLSLGNAIGPAIARILGQFGADSTLYVPDRSTRQADGSTLNGQWLALPGVVPISISAITEEDRIREYGADLEIDVVAYMPLPSGLPVTSLPNMGVKVLAGIFAGQSFRIVVPRPSDVAGAVKLALVRLKTPIA